MESGRNQSVVKFETPVSEEPSTGKSAVIHVVYPEIASTPGKTSDVLMMEYR